MIEPGQAVGECRRCRRILPLMDTGLCGPCEMWRQVVCSVAPTVETLPRDGIGSRPGDRVSAVRPLPTAQDPPHGTDGQQPAGRATDSRQGGHPGAPGRLSGETTGHDPRRLELDALLAGKKVPQGVSGGTQDVPKTNGNGHVTGNDNGHLVGRIVVSVKPPREDFRDVLALAVGKTRPPKTPTLGDAIHRGLLETLLVSPRTVSYLHAWAKDHGWNWKTVESVRHKKLGATIQTRKLSGWQSEWVWYLTGTFDALAPNGPGMAS